mmetsp:Transcript_21044/g.45058  ORF Transcript_21044/g.45058 Transcript_21044/m.45058 type:complete len:222 (-) Transcript_21044:124-789(-)
MGVGLGDGGRRGRGSSAADPRVGRAGGGATDGAGRRRRSGAPRPSPVLGRDDVDASPSDGRRDGGSGASVPRLEWPCGNQEARVVALVLVLVGVGILALVVGGVILVVVVIVLPLLVLLLLVVSVATVRRGVPLSWRHSLHLFPACDCNAQSPSHRVPLGRRAGGRTGDVPLVGGDRRRPHDDGVGLHGHCFRARAHPLPGPSTSPVVDAKSANAAAVSRG